MRKSRFSEDRMVPISRRLAIWWDRPAVTCKHYDCYGAGVVVLRAWGGRSAGRVFTARAPGTTAEGIKVGASRYAAHHFGFDGPEP